MSIKKAAPTVFILAVIVLALSYSLSESFKSYFDSLHTSEPKFSADDWSPKGAVPLPAMGEVDIAKSKFYEWNSPQESPKPHVFDSANALDRPSWKLIVIDQYSGRPANTTRWDSKLLSFMETIKSSQEATSAPLELWFLRLNRAPREDVWTDPFMFKRCGADGRECFDHYLVFAESSLDYSLELSYLESLSDTCTLVKSSPALSVVVVDPEGNLRHTYSACNLGVSLQRLAKNFEHHSPVKFDARVYAQKDIFPPAYSLEPSVQDNLTMSGQSLLQQTLDKADDALKSAKSKFDERVESWKEE